MLTRTLLIVLAVVVGLSLYGLIMTNLAANGGYASFKAYQAFKELNRDPSSSETTTAGAKRGVDSQDEELTAIQLPEPPIPSAVLTKKVEEFKSGALLLDIANACIWELRNGKALYVPVTPALQEKGILPQAINPITGEKITPPQELLRSSIWFMPVGQKMIMGALFQDQGIALVYMERLSEDRYRRSIESLDGQVLEVREGVLERVNPNIGLGRIKLGPPTEGEFVLASYCQECEWWFWSFYYHCWPVPCP